MKNKLVQDTVQVILQVNGKVRSKVEVEKDLDQAELEKIALADERIQQWTAEKDIKKVIVIPNKIVNIVAK